MTFFEAFVDEMEKIGIAGKPLGRTMERASASDPKIKFFKSIGNRNKVVEGIDEAATAAAKRSELASGFRLARKHLGPATARSHLAQLRTEVHTGQRLGKGRAAMSIPLSEKRSLVKSHEAKAESAGDAAFKNQSKKELERGIRKGEV